MKKKQFMSKLAALTMAAMMGLSAVPASAVSVLAETSIDSDTAVSQKVKTTDIPSGDSDLTAAVGAFTAPTVDLSSVTTADEAVEAIGSKITANIHGAGSKAATIAVNSFDATNHELKGTATWSNIPGTVVENAGDGATTDYYDIVSITVPFTAKTSDWSSTPATVHLEADNSKASGTKLEYANTATDNIYDADDLTKYAQLVKDAVEATDTTVVAQAGDTSKLDLTATRNLIAANVIKAVQSATNVKTEVTSTNINVKASSGSALSDGDALSSAKKISGSVVLSVPQDDGTYVFETIGFTTDAKSARGKKVAAAAKDVQTALTGDSDYSVSTDNPIDKVIAQVLSDKGYKDVQLDSYYVSKNTASNYAGSFTLVMPEVKDAAGKIVNAKETADGTFSLNTGVAETSLTDQYITNFSTAIKNAPMYDDTTADELTTYLNSDQFKVSGKTLKENGISVSNVVINGVTSVAHGVDGKADVTLTLTDESGKTIRKSYEIDNVKHSDSTKLKEATDTVATVAAKVDTSKAQKNTDTTALKLGSHELNKEFVYNASEAKNTSVEGLAQTVVKSALNTVINAKAANSSDRKLSLDFASAIGTNVVDVVAKKTNATAWTNGVYSYDKNDKFLPTIKITNYMPATSAKEGTATVEVTFRTPNDDYALDNSTGAPMIQSSTATFTLAFGKLKAKASTYIELGSTQYMTLFTVDKDGNVTTTYSSKTLKATTDGNDPINWTSSDPSVAIVDANGKVTAKGLGTTTITATDANNASVSDSVAVVVKNNDKYKFVDVQDANKFYFSPVYAAAEKNVTAGTDATHFSPDAPVTRAQFITWLYKLAGEPAVTVTDKFTDVSADKWYTNAVSWALENGITAGTTSTTFSPDQTLTRGQAMMFLYKAYGKGQTYNRELALQFKDVSETSPFAEAINWGLNKNITNGYTTTQFGTDDPCTRGQAVTFLSGYLGIKS